MDYQTPGVYVEEIQTLPPSVAPVATAVPAFIGYTQFARDNDGNDQDGVVARRITSLKEYEQYFGDPERTVFRVAVDTAGNVQSITRLLADGATPAGLLPSYLMYYAIRFYFDNGGGPCHIISIGRYALDGLGGMNPADFQAGLERLQERDEPTLIITPDAVQLDDADFYTHCQQVLTQCNLLKDRFGVFDVREGAIDGTAFRDGIGNNFLNYGAAYTPYLQTTLTYIFDEADVQFPGFAMAETDTNGLFVIHQDQGAGFIPPPPEVAFQAVEIGFEMEAIGSTIRLIISGLDAGRSRGEIVAAWTNFIIANDPQSFSVMDAGGGGSDVDITENDGGIVIPDFYELPIQDPNGLRVIFSDTSVGGVPQVQILIDGTIANSVEFIEEPTSLTITLQTDPTPKEDILTAWQDFESNFFDLEDMGNPGTGINALLAAPLTMNTEGHSTDSNGIHIRYNGPFVSAEVAMLSTGTIGFDIPDPGTPGVTPLALTISGILTSGTSPAEIIGAWNSLSTEERRGFHLFVSGDGTNLVTPLTIPVGGQVTLANLAGNLTLLYNNAITALRRQRVLSPSSPAIAGIYASVDRNRGVWKAPANVSLASVIEPVAFIDTPTQGLLNVDATSGKSINAIRAFTGRGTLIWGARTLAGNDNEWRYINVRRLFIFIEESIQKATSFVVFESNTATTWLKVKGLIESFLFGLWQQGALAGPTPEAAYVVEVGLGKTMTPQDILDGKLIVDVKIAAVRPAEFIVLRFFHKLQEA